MAVMQEVRLHGEDCRRGIFVHVGASVAFRCHGKESKLRMPSTCPKTARGLERVYNNQRACVVKHPRQQHSRANKGSALGRLS